MPTFTVNGISMFDSTKIDEPQLEQNHFAVLSYSTTVAGLSAQASTFARYSTLSFRPDRLADLMFNGIAQRVDRSSIAAGLQLDGTYALTSTHTLQGGVYFAAEETSVQTSSDVLPAAGGPPAADTPVQV